MCSGGRRDKTKMMHYNLEFDGVLSKGKFIKIFRFYVPFCSKTLTIAGREYTYANLAIVLHIRIITSF